MRVHRPVAGLAGGSYRSVLTVSGLGGTLVQAWRPEIPLRAHLRVTRQPGLVHSVRMRNAPALSEAPSRSATNRQPTGEAVMYRTRSEPRPVVHPGAAVAGGQRQPRPGPARHRDRPADGGAGRDDRERRAAAHPAGARVLRHRPGVGRQRLCAHASAGCCCSAAGPVTCSAAAGVFIAGLAAVLGRVAGSAASPLPGLAAGRPGAPGRRRRDGRADRARADHHDLRGGPAA